MDERTRERERRKREGVARRAHERLNGEYRDPYTGELVVVVNGVATHTGRWIPDESVG